MKPDWTTVADTMRAWAAMPELNWKFGQEDGLRWMADRIATAPGLLIADEVGLGKTRLAIAAMHAVSLAGGRVFVAAPATLLHQWDDERTKFLKALGTPEPPRPTGGWRTLRHFNDLFGADRLYPLSSRHPYVLASHAFGIPRRTSGSASPHAWALPYIVRSFARHGIDNWKGARDLKGCLSDERLDMQLAAARWLALRVSALEDEMAALSPPDAGTGATVQPDGARERRLRTLSRKLVGRLMGPFDLVVVDEAHKSREEAHAGAPASKRLTNLLSEIVMRRPGAKSLALTATPVQLAPADWGLTLRRIGLDGEDLARRVAAIERFDATCKSHRVGPATDADVEELCEAARGFQDALSDVVVRRRWSDQRIMTRARSAFGDDGAHPHRRWTTTVLAWSGLPPLDRMAFLAAEGRALASRGTDLEIVERHRASRHAQAMDEIDEEEVEGTASPPAAGAPPASGASRHAYWTGLQTAMRADHARDGTGGLARHPRIREACSWVEGVTEVGPGKVLVFANYTKPLVALSRSLNVRKFLREVASGVPTLAPVAFGGSAVEDHPLISAVLETMPDRDRIVAAGDLRTLVRDSEENYRSASQGLADILDRRLSTTGIGPSGRVAIRLAALEWMLEAGGAPEEVEARVADLARGLAAAPPEEAGGVAGPRKGTLIDALEAEAGYSGLARSEFARELRGGSSASTKHVLQALFNTPSLRPRVLVAQSRVAAEGLNLHEACRHVLFLHLDWNPATIEQQIGRVDRVGSLWSRDFEASDGGSGSPRIELATIVIGGTSDAERKSRILERQRSLGAHLFGELLPPDIMCGLSPEWRTKLNAASPSFAPPVRGGPSTDARKTRPSRRR